MRANSLLTLGLLVTACSGGVDSSDGPTYVCGNGIREPLEACDDGNTEDGDCCNATCSAGSCLVPQTHDSIQDGVDDPACPTVWVMPGDYAENVMVRRDVRIEAVAGGEVVLDGAGAGSVVRVTGAHTVALVGLTLTGGEAEAGGGVRNDGGALTLSSSVVRGNRSSGPAAQGAGIWSTGGSVALEASVVRENEAVGTARAAEGGGVSIHDGALTLEGSEVVDNVVTVIEPEAAAGRGGGVALQDGELRASDSLIARNRVDVRATSAGAIAQGGGVSVIGAGLVELRASSRVADNVVHARGPAVHALGGGVAGPAPTVRLLEGAAVAGNTARAEGSAGRTDAHGGGVSLVDGGALELSGEASLSNNLAHASGPDAHALGGGAACDGATLSLADATLVGNAARVSSADPNASAFGGALSTFLEGAVTRELTLERGLLAENVAEVLRDDGGAATGGSASGGAIFADVSVAGARLAIALRASTLSGNRATAGTLARGGGVGSFADVADAQLTLAITNATLSGNRAEAATASGGALALVARHASSRASLELSSSTVVENTVVATALGLGGGLEVDGEGAASAVVTARNSVLAANTASGGADCAVADAALVSEGYNLLGDADRCAFAGDTSGHLVGADPGLEPLADAGGGTPTHALSASSAAVDAGDPAGCRDELGAALPEDQRGMPRDAGGRCDLGAYERQP